MHPDVPIVQSESEYRDHVALSKVAEAPTSEMEHVVKLLDDRISRLAETVHVLESRLVSVLREDVATPDREAAPLRPLSASLPVTLGGFEIRLSSIEETVDLIHRKLAL